MANPLAITALLAACGCFGVAAAALVPVAVGRSLAARGIVAEEAPAGARALALGAVLAAGLLAVAVLAWPAGNAGRLAGALAVVGATMGVAAAISLCDWAARTVPNGMVAVLAVLGAAFQIVLGGPAALVSGAVAGAVLSGLLVAASLPFGRGALGGGDVKLVLATGLALGWPMAVQALCGALLAVAVVMGVRALRGRAGLSSTFALGPYLCCALVIGQAALLTV